MTVLEPLFAGLGQLRAHKLRSLLTLLGIVIGVAAIIAVVSLGEGLRREVISQFVFSGGAGMIEVEPPRQWVRKDGRWVRRPWEEHLTAADMAAMLREIDGLHALVPSVEGSASLQRGKTTVDARYTGTSGAFNEGFNWPVISGRPLSADDLRFARKVCLLGDDVHKDLFQGANPLGEEILLNGDRYVVIGVLDERVRFGRSDGNIVLVPYTTAQKRLRGEDHFSELTLFVEDLAAVERVVAAVRRVLRRHHEHGDEFRIETSQGEIDDANEFFRVLQQVGGGIAGISLLVGGIGIMNILLVSVAERTREIGIRKALGAKPRHILGQFLAESVVLSMVGGLLGILTGFGFGLGAAFVIQQLAPGAPFTSIVSAESVLWAVGFSSVVGIFFGVYPAFRAARLDPVEALRRT
ncbi:MAG: FtsX-like permease family protein [Gemmatimonadetes bacterium]|nr:FtsX-like permease family protein [Gemmatimonadota bacterium]MYB68432.1 FtsX-like permease family protein [Gemmatimonadota bacterium]